jgi:hypothetical protein
MLNESLPGKLEALILARLSVRAKRPPSAGDVSAALHKMLASQITKQDWQVAFTRALASLRAAGLIDAGLSLTKAGVARLSRALQVKASPRTKSWKEFKSKYLPRLFLGDKAPPEGTKIDASVAVLARELGVSFTAKSTLSSVCNAWLVQKLALPSNNVNLGTLRAALLANELQLPRRGKFEQISRLAVTTLSGAPKFNGDAVTNALVTRWLFAEPEPTWPNEPTEPTGRREPQPPETDQSLHRLVAKVRAASEGAHVRSFGTDKVFIASVWQALAGDPEVVQLGQARFKALLAEAHRRGLLVLSRADLVAAMDPADVSASETQHQNATYHFIQRGASA